MDLLKSALSFTVAGAVSFFVIDSIQMSRTEVKARADAFYTSRLKALDDFRTASIAYDMSAYLAYWDLYHWQSKQKTPAMLVYEQEAFSKWALSLESLAYLFPSQEATAKALSSLGAKRYNLYAALVNVRLEGSDRTAIDPQATQKQFNDATDEIRIARSVLINALQASLFPTASKELSSKPNSTIEGGARKSGARSSP